MFQYFTINNITIQSTFPPSSRKLSSIITKLTFILYLSKACCFNAGILNTFLMRLYKPAENLIFYINLEIV